MTRGPIHRRAWIVDEIKKLTPYPIAGSDLAAVANTITNNAFIAVAEDDAEWFRVLAVFRAGIDFERLIREYETDRE